MSLAAIIGGVANMGLTFSNVGQRMTTREALESDYKSKLITKVEYDRRIKAESDKSSRESHQTMAIGFGFLALFLYANKKERQTLELDQDQEA